MMRHNEWQATVRRVTTSSQGQIDATYLLSTMTPEARQEALGHLVNRLPSNDSNFQIIVVRF
jgi:hypothetical protein